VALGCLSLCGCPSGSNDGQTATQSASSDQADDGQSDRCAAILNSLFDVYRIERFESTFDLATGAARLNDWQRSCSATQESEAPALPEGARKLFSDAQFAILSGQQFRQRDASHVRDCILFQALARRITQIDSQGAGLSDLEKSIRVFEHVTRALQLPGTLEQQNRHAADLPFTPYEFYLMGRGTSVDRAWLAVNILRSLRIDAVLLTAGDSDDPGLSDLPTGFLVAVLVEGQAYLFDPALGVPVAAPGGEPGKLRPATLTEVLADPALLTRLDTPARKYPLTSESLRQPRVLMVGDLPYFSLRAQSLQQAFSGNRTVVVSEPLEDQADVPGLWSRIVTAGRGGSWNESQISLWRYPQEQVARSLSSTDDQNEIRKGLKLPFMAYLVVTPDPANPGQVSLTGVQEFRDPALQGLDSKDKDLAGFSRTDSKTTSGRQMDARLKQLAGDLPAALKGYVEVQSNARTILAIPKDPLVIRLQGGPAIDVKRFHFRAIDDAAVWSGLCQYEQGEFSAAASTFERYLRQASRLSEWTRHARYLLAVSQAAQGKYAEAAATLEVVPEEDPEYPGFQAQIQCWKAVQ